MNHTLLAHSFIKLFLSVNYYLDKRFCSETVVKTLRFETSEINLGTEMSKFMSRDLESAMKVRFTRQILNFVKNRNSLKKTRKLMILNFTLGSSFSNFENFRHLNFF